MSSLYIAAAHKSSGKTVIVTGLCRALSERGLSVQPFKKGPDYIDPIWLSMAAGRDCHNLDFHTMGRSEICSTFERFSGAADVSLVEGNKGLYDGVDPDGRDSNAALARLLGLPVVLVIDTSGMTRGIAPLLQGYQGFDRRVRVVGVILNRVAGARHEGKLRAAVERYTDLPVWGAVARDQDLQIVERHLGLVPGNELGKAREIIATIGAAIRQQVDLDRISSLPGPSPSAGAVHRVRSLSAADVRIGIAQDAAFGFYYPGDLEALRAAGAELVPLDTLRDGHLPPVDGLFIGGGFPETQMHALEANRALRRAIRQAIEAGLPTYAECGGLMYLSRSIQWCDRRCEMVGIIPADTVMGARPQGRGYVRLRETGNGPWPLRTQEGVLAAFSAHEFHYARLSNHGPFRYAYEVLRGHGIDGKHDGIAMGNLLASFSHLRDVAANHWTERFVSFVRTHRSSLRRVVSL